MSDQNRISAVETDPNAARIKNRRNMWVIAGFTAVAAAVIAGMLLIPNRAVIKDQIQQEKVNQAVSAANGAPTTKDGRAQVVVSSGTFVVGSEKTLVGNDAEVLDIVNAKTPGTFSGQIVLRGVQVQTVPGDQVFSVGPTPSQSIIVKIDEPTEPGPKPEHVLVVRPGQKVVLSGTVQEIPSLEIMKKTWGITSREAGHLGNTALYIKANTVQIL